MSELIRQPPSRQPPLDQVGSPHGRRPKVPATDTGLDPITRAGLTQRCSLVRWEGPLAPAAPAGNESKQASPPSSRTSLASLIIPTYNERENILTLLDQVRAALAGRAFEICVVDDDSPDGTWWLVESYRADCPEVSVLRRRGERGLSSAVVEGFRHARGVVLAVMDADLSHDPALLPALLDAVEGGADVAVGSRRVPGGGADVWPWYRRLASDFATHLARRGLGVPLADPMSGYFALRRDVFETVRDRVAVRGYKILLEIVARAAPLTLVELPYVFRDRRQGVSKLSARIMLAYLAQVWALRRETRLRPCLAAPVVG